MKDLAAVAPLLLVAAVFVGVCITALRATDWRRVVDRRPDVAARREAERPAPEQPGTDAEDGEPPAPGTTGGRHRGSTPPG